MLFTKVHLTKRFYGSGQSSKKDYVSLQLRREEVGSSFVLQASFFMPEVFVSYCQHDADRVKPLVTALELDGISVFWDRKVPPGENWYEYIGKALNEAACIVVVWSQSAVKSNWVIEEAEDGKARNILVPVSLDAVLPPLGFRSIQAMDISKWSRDSNSPELKNLIKRIRDKVDNGQDAKSNTVAPLYPRGRKRSGVLSSLLSFLNAGKGLFTKSDYEHDDRMLDQLTHSFFRVIHEERNSEDCGLRRIRAKFDTNELKDLILNLSPGDTLYCHVDLVPHFSRLQELIICKALVGVKFRVMALAPFCRNATRRAGEVGRKTEFYSSGCLEFIKAIEIVIEELAKKLEVEGRSFVTDEMIKLKLYRSLMSIPFYMVVRNDKPILALTGFHLCKDAQYSIYIEWAENCNNHFVKTNHAGGVSFIGELLDYWEQKWNLGCNEYRHEKLLEGEWLE